MSRLASSSVVLGVLACGCAGGTETGNPPLNAQLSYQAYSSDSGLGVGASSNAAALHIDAVWLGLGPVGFTSGTSCSPAAAPSVEAPGIGVGNHATGHPVTTHFEAAAGHYCAIELPLTLADALPSQAPPELAGNSVLVLGKLADGTPFSIESTATPELVLLANDGAFALASGSEDTLMGFDVAAWLDGIDWTSAERTGDAIEIAPGTNTELLAVFEANFAGGVVLFRDRDGDGLLDDNPERLTN